MSDGRLFLLLIGLLIVATGVLALAAAIIARVVAARRQRQVAVLDDGSDRPIYDIPILFHPTGTLAPKPAPAKSVAPAPPPAASGSGQEIQEMATAESPPEPASRALAVNGSRAPSPWEIVPGEVLAADATVQFLPGRLEPLSGGERQEIRFVKLKHITRFTFGRSSGPEYQHIQLSAPTASRMHGYMVYESGSGRWRIGNLSETNPVVVNGQPLTAQDSNQLLEDGDRIEFGEIGFRFHER